MKYIAYLKDCKIIHCESGIARISNHYHVRRNMKQTELMLMVEGFMHIHHIEEYTLHSGDIFFLPQGIEHYGTMPSTGVLHWFHFYLPDDFLLIEENEIKSLDIEKYFIFPMQFKVNNMNNLTSLGFLLEQYPNTQATKYIRDSLLTAILCDINAQLTDYNYGKFITHKRLNSILNYINSNIQKDITIKDLALHFGYNEKYIFTIFKQYLNISPLKYINIQKLNGAKSLLLNTDNTITAISLMLGYSNPQYFMRLFKKTFGMTPSDLRKNYSHTVEVYLLDKEVNN